MTQQETQWLGEPFGRFLRERSWHVENIHCNQYQKGLPDKFICNPDYCSKWMELKIIKGNVIELTEDQKLKFPVLHAFGVPIYVLVTNVDLRRKENEWKLERLYQKLFKEPNVTYVFNKRTHYLLK